MPAGDRRRPADSGSQHAAAAAAAAAPQSERECDSAYTYAIDILRLDSLGALDARNRYLSVCAAGVSRSIQRRCCITPSAPCCEQKRGTRLYHVSLRTVFRRVWPYVVPHTTSCLEGGIHRPPACTFVRSWCASERHVLFSSFQQKETPPPPPGEGSHQPPHHRFRASTLQCVPLLCCKWSTLEDKTQAAAIDGRGLWPYTSVDEVLRLAKVASLLLLAMISDPFLCWMEVYGIPIFSRNRFAGSGGRDL